MVEAKATAAFPLLMGIYMLFYAIWLPIGWAAVGWVLFAVTALLATAAIWRGIRQLRHANSLPDVPATETGARRGKQMGILNSVTHPIWLLGAIVLATLGYGRWIVPLIVFVVGAHFLPIAKIMNRRIDYLLGPVAMMFAVVAAVLAVNPAHHWGGIAALAGLGGYAWYMAANYRALVTP